MAKKKAVTKNKRIKKAHDDGKTKLVPSTFFSPSPDMVDKMNSLCDLAPESSNTTSAKVISETDIGIMKPDIYGHTDEQIQWFLDHGYNISASTRTNSYHVIQSYDKPGDMIAGFREGDVIDTEHDLDTAVGMRAYLSEQPQPNFILESWRKLV
jgi:hypothetical protein